MHILMTVNAAWNIWNFRRPLVEALAAGSHPLGPVQIVAAALAAYREAVEESRQGASHGGEQ